MIHALASPNRICVQEHFRIRSACPNVAPSAPQLRQKFRPPIQPYVRGNPQPPVKPRRLPLFQRLPRCPQHGMSEPDGAFCPNAARIRPAKRQKVRKALQEPPVYRRIVPVVDADDTAQLLGLSIKRAGCSRDKTRRRAANASLFGCPRPMPRRTRFEALHNALIRIACFIRIRLDPNCTGPRHSRQQRDPIRNGLCSKHMKSHASPVKTAQHLASSKSPTVRFEAPTFILQL